MTLPETVGAKEMLARYLTQKKGHYSVERNEVLPKAFMPPLNLRRSVFRIDGLTLDEVWDIGQREVVDALPQAAMLHGSADIKASMVRKYGLDIAADDTPPRHAEIVGWPEWSEKDEIKSIAQQLAAEAKLVLKEPAAEA